MKKTFILTCSEVTWLVKSALLNWLCALHFLFEIDFFFLMRGGSCTWWQMTHLRVWRIKCKKVFFFYADRTCAFQVATLSIAAFPLPPKQKPKYCNEKVVMETPKLRKTSHLLLKSFDARMRWFFMRIAIEVYAKRVMETLLFSHIHVSRRDVRGNKTSWLQVKLAQVLVTSLFFCGKL